MEQVVLIASGKGGAGKSSFCVSLAGSLAKMGKKTILIDLDFGLRSLDIMLGLDQNPPYNLGDVLNETCEPGKAIVAADDNYMINLISAPANPEAPTKLENLGLLLNLLQKHYDYVLIDCGAGISSPFRQCIPLCGTAIVVTNPDPVCIRDGAVISDFMFRHGLQRQKLVINKANLTYKLNPVANFDDIIDTIAIPLLGVVPYDMAVTTAAANGRLLDFDQSSIYQKAIFNIACRVTGTAKPLLIH